MTEGELMAPVAGKLKMEMVKELEYKYDSISTKLVLYGEFELTETGTIDIK